MVVIRNALAKIAAARRVETSRLCVFSGILDRRIREHQLIQLAEGVCDIAAVEMNTELAFLHVDVRPTDTQMPRKPSKITDVRRLAAQSPTDVNE